MVRSLGCCICWGFSGKSQHTVMSPYRDKEQHSMYSFQQELNYLHTDKGVEELKLGFQEKLKLG